MNFRTKKITRGTALAAALALFVGVATLFAVVPPPDPVGFLLSFFELGPGAANSGGGEAGVANIRNDGNTGTGPDWSCLVNTGDGLFDKNGDVCNASSPPSRFGDVLGGTASFAQDDVSAGSLTDRTVYSGGPGDKNSYPISKWTWATSSVPAKDDVTNGYAFTKEVTGPPITLPDGTTTTTHKLLYVGVEREDPSGDSHVDVEFFQALVGLDHSVPCPKNCGFTGSNTNGDLLVNMDFTKGGDFGTLSVRQRHEGARDNYDDVETLTAEGCSTDNKICGFNNGESILNGATVVADAWKSRDNHAAVILSLQTNTLTEFGLDVTALGFGIPCFSTIEIKTRSSQSFTASLKDFTLQRFQQCVATIATEIHDGVAVGATHNVANIDINADCSGSTFADCGRGTIHVGDTVHDKAIVTGTKGFPSPTGNGVTTGVRFLRWDNVGCDGDPAQTIPPTGLLTLTQILAPTATAGGKSAVESTNFTSTASGGVSYKAVYVGDSNYPTTITSDCEGVTILRLTSEVITRIRNGAGNDITNQKVINGTAVVDYAYVYGLDVGLNKGTTGPDPGGPETTGGSVTFQLYPNANCSGTTFTTLTGTRVATDTTRDRTSTFVSPTQTPNVPEGTFLCFKATYSGDNVYGPPDSPSVIEPICVFSEVTQPPL